MFFQVAFQREELPFTEPKRYSVRLCSAAEYFSATFSIHSMAGFTDP